MAFNDNRRMSARLLSFVIWAAVAASAVFWGLRLAVSPPRTPAHAVTTSESSPRGDLTRLFGAATVPASGPAAVEPSLASRFKLIGVVAPRPPGAKGGVALISVDGKPARPFRAGAAVDGDLLLASVRSRGASLSPRSGAGTVELELPPLPAAATGTLPPGGGPRPGPTPTPSSTPPPGAVMPPGPGAVPAGAPATPATVSPAPPAAVPQGSGTEPASGGVVVPVR